MSTSAPAARWHVVASNKGLGAAEAAVQRLAASLGGARSVPSLTPSADGVIRPQAVLSKRRNRLVCDQERIFLTVNDMGLTLALADDHCAAAGLGAASDVRST